MELNECIKQRKSIRSYKQKAVSLTQIKTLMEAVNLAPSWKNSQTSRYCIILDEAKKQQFKETCLPLFNAENCKNVSALIVSSYIENRSGFNKDGTPTNELNNQWGAYDLGLHDAYLILKAKEMGLDTLIMGIRDAAQIKQFCRLKEEEVVVSVIALGYADNEPQRPTRRATEEIMKMIEGE